MFLVSHEVKKTRLLPERDRKKCWKFKVWGKSVKSWGERRMIISAAKHCSVSQEVVKGPG